MANRRFWPKKPDSCKKKIAIQAHRRYHWTEILGKKVDAGRPGGLEGRNDRIRDRLNTEMQNRP